jgi:hypothetical protein
MKIISISTLVLWRVFDSSELEDLPSEQVLTYFYSVNKFLTGKYSQILITKYFNINKNKLRV